MDKSGNVGGVLEQGQQTVQNTVKSAVSDVAWFGHQSTRRKTGS